MAPSDYIQSRELAAQAPDGGRFFATLVDGRPYLPSLTVDASDEASVCLSGLASVVLSVYVAASNGSPNVDAGGALAAKEGAELKALPLSVDWDALLRESSASLTCTKVTGGITNALFRVSGFQSLKPAISSTVSAILGEGAAAEGCASLVDMDSVLIRIFGAEGMINRDVETSTYAALCNADIAYRYLCRFGNGRVEGWLDGFVPLKCADLTHDGTSLEIAKEMARLHCLFEVPPGELRDHHFGTELDVISVGLWDQLSSWMEQAKGYSVFKTPRDTERARALELDRIEAEVNGFITSFSTAPSDTVDKGEDSTASVAGSAKIVFAHNDLLAANIMRHPETGKIQLIDFEYGGTNYAAFDIANHFNEHAGGTSAEENGNADYSRFPNPHRQKSFCVEYVRTAKRLESMKSDITEPSDDGSDDDAGLHAEAADLLSHVQKFVLINHLYWGLWAVNQAAEEGCEEFDYINYASNRFNMFWKIRQE